MQIYVRICLDMAGKALAFCLAHPDADRGGSEVVARLALLVARADILTLQQRASQAEYSAAASQKAQYRTEIENGLASLFGCASAAARAHPELAVHRRRPRPGSSEIALLTVARAAVAEATTSRELLIPYGLPAGLIDNLTEVIDGFEAEIARQGAALAAQVGATADLRVVTRDIIRTIRNLDAVHRVRFAGDRELMAAWKSARNARWRHRVPVAPLTPVNPQADNADAA